MIKHQKTQYELYNANTMQKQQQIKNPNFVKKDKFRT